MSKPRILILNGPNLQKTGEREPHLYGNRDLGALMSELEAAFDEVDFEHLQSNQEGDLIDALHRIDGRFIGVVLNAGGYSHTSVAIRDAISSIGTPVVEVHMSNLLAREPFRHSSIIGAVCDGTILGFGFDGYHLAVHQLIKAGASNS